MKINNVYPWILLGYDYLYVRQPGQSRWQTLFQDEISWAARVSTAGGQEFLRQPGQKLGLNDSETGKQLDKIVLKQLLEHIGEPTVLFAPLRQASGLQQAAQEMASPPDAITLDSRLMTNI